MLRRATLLPRRLLSTYKAQHALPPLPSIALPEYIMQRSREFGDRPALIDGPTGRMLKYSEIEPSIRRVAANLAARGLQHNDVIGILSPNCIEYPLALHAAASLGARVTTLNPLYTPLEVAQQLRDAGASQLIVGNSTTLLETARAAIAEGAAIERLYTFDEAPEAEDGTVEPFAALLEDVGAPPPPPPSFDPAEQVAVIPYSSGTSGLCEGLGLEARTSRKKPAAAHAFGPCVP